MPNISNKVRVVLWLDGATAARIEEARMSTNLRSKQQWIYMAISSYLGRWKKPMGNAKLWERCYLCNKQHDPQEHFEK